MKVIAMALLLGGFSKNAVWFDRSTVSMEYRPPSAYVVYAIAVASPIVRLNGFCLLICNLSERFMVNCALDLYWGTQAHRNSFVYVTKSSSFVLQPVFLSFHTF